jgi:lipopolysaccharide biosynthesis regulator YciM
MLGAAFALLAVGALLGDLWARLRSRRWKSASHQARPHYLLGLNYLVSNHPNQAIRELSKAIREETDAVEAYLALGNLFRENGQTERAIDLHKSLLHRPDISEWERTQVLFSLAMDFKKAGLIDRAERTFDEVIGRDPTNVACLYGLQRIAEETGRWEEALDIQGRIQRLTQGSEEELAPALESEWGTALSATDLAAATVHYRAALDRRPDYAPAHLGMGVAMVRQGKPEAGLDHLEQAVESGAPWGHAALEPMAEACAALNDSSRLERACGRLLRLDPRAWRANLMMASLHMDAGDGDAAREALERALGERPGSLAVQRQLWELLQRSGQGIEEFIAMLDSALADARLVDPFVCLRCRFKSAELFARCPHCHEWNTMNEERQD